MNTIQFKEANCKNCYKCIRSCPVKAIAFKDDQAMIMEENCVLCGKCLQVCPQNAKSVKNDVDRVRRYIKMGEKVYASIAPSFAASFDTNWQDVFQTLRRLGFTHVEETALGAAQVSSEYGRLQRDGKMANIITSACPTIVFLVEKYYPELIEFLAPVVSPMIAHARMMRKAYGQGIRVVFIGPCLSKKEEYRDLKNDETIDAVITFEELDIWMKDEGTSLSGEYEEERVPPSNLTSRFYPAPGGILKTLEPDSEHRYKCISIDGIDRCMETLESLRSKEAGNYFIEMNSCAGGCLGGPFISASKGSFLKARDKLAEYVTERDREGRQKIIKGIRTGFSKRFVDKSIPYDIPDEETIRELLASIGKLSINQELNCGACGYSTCREKAIAVYNKKAELHMCLPYMRERAESISNIIIHSTPNAIFALDSGLRIQEMNTSAFRMFNPFMEDFIGRNIFEVLECPDFDTVRETGEDILNSKYYYEKYDTAVEQSILYVREHGMIIVVIKNTTREEKQQQKMYRVRCETVDIAQKVIDKQMRVAQEIASLLGETTAETKVALTRLKNSILDEIGEKK